MSGLETKYFVLKPKGSDEYARASRSAMKAYAHDISYANPLLADELIKKSKRVKIMKKFKLKEDILFFKKGDVVYEYIGYDYGLSRNATRFYKEAYVSVSVEPGSTPFFTVPVRTIEEVSDV